MDPLPASLFVLLTGAGGCALLVVQCLRGASARALVILGAVLAGVLVVSFTELDVVLDAGPALMALVFAGYLFASPLGMLLPAD